VTATTRTAPYGSWKSPITAEIILSGTVGLGEIRLDGDDIYWLESRAQEGGRLVLVRRDAQGDSVDLTPAPFNVRSRVHEYGGGAYTVADGIVYFSNFADNRLYRIDPGAEPLAITADGALRYADLVLDGRRNRLIAVREDHTLSARDAENTIVAIGANGDGSQRVLVAGNDFYASPRLSSDGTQLSWLSWNHPNMPWDGCELWVATVDGDGMLSEPRQVAGGREESIFQPEWSPDGTLYFVSDRTGWWNLYRLGSDGTETVTDREEEFGVPQWVFGMSTYAFVGSDRIVCTIQASGSSYLAEVNPLTGGVRRIETPYVDVSGVRSGENRAVFLGYSATKPAEVAEWNLRSGAIETLRSSGSIPVSSDYFSLPQSIEFPTEGGLTAYAIYYPPHNPDFTAPEGELPPLIVASHGGPTGSTSGALDLSSVQFWTSRGFAVVDVNYGGSSGYGRAYRERLNGQWGVVDVDDCANAARYLAERGLADPQRLIIHGWSAGGYTTLAALAFRDVFSAGASHFGIGDLEAIARDSHKFESRYEHRLVGPLPEALQLYHERSAIYHVDQIGCPVIIFQGEDDRVVPPNQARLMIEALARNNLPHAAIFFPGEGHGFRRAENIKRSMEAELYFYSRIFGFDLAEEIEPVPIVGLQSSVAEVR
jgi:dipeptidyl aminopeptidase/acylaminoacyl peptidase